MLQPPTQFRYWLSCFLVGGVASCVAWITSNVHSAEPADDGLKSDFDSVVTPFLQTHCLDCHGEDLQEAKLDLSSYSSPESVSRSHQTWEIVLERLAANEMPPDDVVDRPKASDRDAVIKWIRDLRTRDANRNAGDPGVVLARRLSNAEYDYTIRDLTGADIRPTKTFPVDPANEAGFDNSGESLTMSPALLAKYLDAARFVAEHLVLTPTDLSFAPHPAVTDTDRDKYCVKRIVRFYQEQPTDLADYFYACWEYKAAAAMSRNNANLNVVALKRNTSFKYGKLIWDLLNSPDEVGPTAALQDMFQALPMQAKAARVGCEGMRDFVVGLRSDLSLKFDNLTLEFADSSIKGVHKGSQPFVLWKNRQYATHRRKFDRNVFFVEGSEIPEGTRPEMILPNDEDDQAKHLKSIERFCSTFPDAFYISERGRDYLGVKKDEQEKGRLLSAGFHSMMGYFRDDRPLYDLILDKDGRAELDRLWQELDYVASAPARQYVGFLWFERTDSRYMRDPVFDFARAEDKNAASEAMVKRLAKVYLKKARDNGGIGTPIQAIEEFFVNMNAQLRWVETEELKSEPIHLEALPKFAERAWRRNLLALEESEIRSFYAQLRNLDGLNHEDAIRDSVVAILMSPHFLYRVDLVGNGQELRNLTSNELANRLSYFLWSTMPDQHLLDAEVDSKTIASQVKRMLNDDKTRALATEFAANWLDIRRFEEHNSVDRERFPEFTDELRQAMFEEPIQFFVDMVRSDRSVLELLDADHTFVNPVLAKHYRIENIELAAADDEWVRVNNAQQYGRGGLLPMSVFLTKNAPGLRTSPVKRGYWVVRRLLGERIPPPPPNVPELPEDESTFGDLSLREMLARHRDHQACAGCHDKIDAIGLAFEGFGPVGERRTLDFGGRKVETNALFPDGIKRVGVKGLRSYLLEQRQHEFVDNLCRKFLAYALGRSLMLSDEPLLETMQSNLQADGYRFSSIIESIVTSQQFLYKRGRSSRVEEN